MTPVQLTRPNFARTYRMLVSASLAVFALVLVLPGTLPIPAEISSRIAFVGIAALFAQISLNDFKTRRVPNTVTYPLMAIGIVRAMAYRDGIFLLYWAVLFALWTARFMGGGDAKLLMGLFGLFPDFQLAWFVAVSILVTGLPYLAYKYRLQWRTIPRALQRVLWRLVTLQFLPSQAEFEKEAVPYAFSFCLAGAVYLLMRVVR